MAIDGTQGYPSTEDRIVAEFGGGHDVAGIAARHGLTVEQVYAVVEREVGPAPDAYPSPAAYASPVHRPPQGFVDDDVLVAEYGAGYDVEAIARKHGISVERVYEVVRRVVADDPQPPAPSW